MARPKKAKIPESELLYERFRNARTVYNQHGKQSTPEVEAGCGVRHSLIEDAESFSMNPPRAIDYRTVGKLAEYYGVSAGYLLGTEDNPTYSVSSRAAQEYTGLSEGAVSTLHDFSTAREYVFRDINMLSACVNKLIESRQFSRFMDSLSLADYEAFVFSKSCDEIESGIRSDGADGSTDARKTINSFFSHYDQMRLARFEAIEMLQDLIDEIIGYDDAMDRYMSIYRDLNYGDN